MFGQLKVVGIPDATAVPGLSLIPVAGNGGQYLNGDQWDGYQAERSAVFAHLADNSIDNVVVLTGDIHTSWAMDLTPDPNNPVELAGGYNPVTGGGSRGVEFVGTSVTSSGLAELADVQDAIRAVNPHIKYVDLEQKGYLLVDVTPTLGPGYTLLAFVIVIIGGLGSMPGALFGGVLIGVSEALAGLFFAPSAKSMFGFALLILVLLFRPQGLLGKKP